MNDIENIESDYSAYDSAKEDEDGLQRGRSDASCRLSLTMAIVVGLFVLGGIVLALIPR